MSTFTTRVELYGSPKPKDYEKLHAAMEKEGFSRTVTAGDIVFFLPLGEYDRTSDLDKIAIRESAAKAAATVWEDFGILVTKSDGGRTWRNLRKELAKLALK
jgi:hypothetical protein